MRGFSFIGLGACLSAALVGLAYVATAPGHAEPSADAQAVPAEARQLFKYLQEGRYKAFTAQETKRHPSAGPHTKVGLDVRVFMNDALNQSLAADAAEHPAGSAVVKEMYSAKGDLQGWAVAVKTAAASDDGKGWYWYEVKSTTDNRRPVAAANGVTLCSGCHTAGRDFVLSTYPLE